MFENCKLTIENGNLLDKTYFFNSMPMVVRKAKPMDCLCPYHMNAYKVVAEVLCLRQKWHFPKNFKCPCTCVFCSTAGCDHGKNPLHGICKKFTCERCKKIKCPEEWDKKRQSIWYTSYLQKREGGGNVWMDEAIKGSRYEFMKYVEDELATFKKHEILVSWIQARISWLKVNLPFGHILIKSDFIQNISHCRGAEAVASYYNKRQTQLLVFVVWYHSSSSTLENPSIKMRYYDYVSAFLKHSTLFFKKAFLHLNVYLTTDLPHSIKKVFLLLVYHHLI